MNRKIVLGTTLTLLLMSMVALASNTVSVAAVSRNNSTQVVANTGMDVDTVKRASYLPGGVLEHTLPSGATHFGHMMGVAYNPATDTYWTVDGGTTPSYIYEQSPDGTFLTNGTVPLSGRAIVYRPEDGNIYLRGYYTGLYRLNLPFDGSITEVLPDIFQFYQCGFAFANGGNVFDFYNGIVNEYDFATGNLIRSFSLNPNFPNGTTYPYNCQLASDGTDLYFFSAVDDVYVYDINGNLITIVDLNHPTFDTFNAPWSFSYTNERIYNKDDTDETWYGYRIKEVFPATFALFKDHNPWGYTAIEDLLIAHGISYDVYTSADMGIVDLSPYDKVITASVQGDDFWNALEANTVWFENYASDGGILEMHLCAMPASNSPGKIYPGGFVFYYEEFEEVSIVDPTHPVLNTPNTITDDELDYWSRAVHGWFSAIPPGANEVLEATMNGEPVFADVTFGWGTIFATTQTVEWRAGHGYPEFLENMILYMPMPSFQFNFQVNPYIDIIRFNVGPYGVICGIQETPFYTAQVLGKVEFGLGKAYIAVDGPPDGYTMAFDVISLATLDGYAMLITQDLMLAGPDYIWLTPVSAKSTEGPAMAEAAGSQVAPRAWYDFRVNPWADVYHLNTDLAPWLWGWADPYPGGAPILGYLDGNRFFLGTDFPDGGPGYELAFKAGTKTTLDGYSIKTTDGLGWDGPDYFWLTPP